MPKYFFDTHDGASFLPDADGLVLTDLDEARSEAVKALPDIARDVLPDGEEKVVFVVIRGDTGDALFRASLALKCEWLGGPAAD